jgi:uncharacterized protein (DUF1015 family)
MPAHRIAHPLDIAWVSAGGTGAPNYDEFASTDEVAAAIAAAPDSVLAVEMPHCTAAARAAGETFAESLSGAVRRLHDLKERGRFTRHDDIIAPYRISGDDGTAYGVLVMIDTEQISTSVDDPGGVIRNEDVFAATVAERTALLRELRHLLSPVLLLPSQGGPELERLLADAIGALGPAAVADLDPAGRRHEVWVLPAGDVRDRLLDAVSAGPLVVADGNHRSLAAQQAGLPRFLALVTTPGSVRIQPYNRLIVRLGMSEGQLMERLTAAGAQVDPAPGPLAVPGRAGTVALLLPSGTYDVTLPPVTGGTVVDRLDHTLVERVLFADVLGLEPGDASVRYIGGDYPASWLADEVGAGRAQAAICICPVSVEDFLAVNLQRLKMPRKSTWFTPKARAGLVLAELSGAAAPPA